jgi:hypothetical protein
MKLKDGYVLRKVADHYIALPSGDDLDLNLMITLNDTGAFLWGKLDRSVEEIELVEALLEEYEVDRPTAEASVRRFIDTLNENGFLA